MAELFGIVAGRDLSADEIGGFGSMERDLHAFRPGTVQKFEAPFARIGVMSRYELDHASIKTLADPAVTVCWVGTPPQRTGSTLEQVAKAVVAGGSFNLATLEPRWCCIIVSKVERTSWIISDRYGHCPLYFSRVKDSVVFATKPLAVLRSGLVDRTIDVKGLIDLFTLEYCTGARTLTSSVKVLAPFSVLRSDPKGTQLTSLGDCLWLGGPPLTSKTEAAAQLFAGLDAAVNRAATNARSLTVTLSGGMDSRLLAYCGTKTGKRTRALTFGLPESRDIRYSQLVAKELNIKHSVIDCDGTYLTRWMDYACYVMGGTVGAVHSHILCLADQLTGGEDVVLDGLSGDMLLGGHVKWGMLLPWLRDRGEGKVFSSNARAFTTAAQRSGILQPDILGETRYDPRETLSSYLRGLPERVIWKGYYRFDVLERQRRFIQSGPLLFQPINQVETPFYSPEVTALIGRLPAALLVEQRTYHAMHARHVRELAKLPDSLRAVPLGWPMSVRFMKKMLDAARRKLPRTMQRIVGPHGEATTNWAGWLRTGLSGFVRERLLDGRGAMSAYIRPDRVERLVQAHMLGEADHTQRIGALLAFESFLRQTKSTIHSSAGPMATARSG